MRGQQIQDGTIEQSKLNLATPTTGVQAVTKNYGISKYIGYNTLTSFRQTNKSELSDKITVNDFLYKYDASDTTSVDNGNTVIRTLDNKIYKKIYFDISPTDNVIINNKLSFGTITQLRSSVADFFQITEKDKEGIFVFDSTDTFSEDDGATVILSGNRRYKLLYQNSVYAERFGAKGDGTTDDSNAFIAAFNYAKIVQLRNKDYKASFTIPANKSLIGVGHSDGYNHTTGTLSRIKGTVKLSANSIAENFNVEGSSGNGIEILGIKASVKNVGSHINVGNGFNLTGNDSNNLNYFKLDGCSALDNSGKGFVYDNASTDPELPNCNAGTTINCTARGNLQGGFYINKAIDNTFIAIGAELNIGIGVEVGQYGKGHTFIGHYEEGNTVSEFKLNTGSANNTIYPPRSGSYSDNVINNGTNNTNYGKKGGIPLVNSLAFENIQIFDEPIPGRWKFRRDAYGFLIAEVTNKSEDADLIIQHAGGGVAGLSFQPTSGGNSKAMTSIASLHRNDIAVGTVNATSTKDYVQYFDEIRDKNWLLTFHPDTTPPDGILWNIFFESDHFLKIRFSNITSSNIVLGTIGGTIKGIKIKA